MRHSFSLPGYVVPESIAYAHIQIQENSAATDISAVDTWYNVAATVGDMWSAHEMLNFTLSSGTEILTAGTGIAGNFVMIYNVSFSNAASAQKYRFAIAIDPGGTPSREGTCVRKLSSGGDVGNVSGMAVIALSDGDTLALQVMQDSGVATDITVEEANIVLYRI